MTDNTTATAKRFIERLKTYQSPVEREKTLRYFKTSTNGEVDQFIGVRMGQVFALAKEFITMTPEEIEKLLESKIHEVRAGGCSIMDKQARSKKTTPERRKELYDLYLRRHDRINNWDLVDVCSIHVIGGYLFFCSFWCFCVTIVIVSSKLIDKIVYSILFILVAA